MDNPFIIGYSIALAMLIPILIVQIILSVIDAKKRDRFFLLILAVVLTTYKPALCQDYGDLGALDAALSAKRISDSIAKAGSMKILPETTSVVNYGSRIDTSGVVFVAADNPAMAQINALDGKIDSIKTGVSANKHGKKLFTLEPADQRRYFDHLLRYTIVDTGTVKSWADGLLSILKTEKRRCELIMQTQHGNDRAVVFRHIRALDERIAAVFSYVVYLQKL